MNNSSLRYIAKEIKEIENIRETINELTRCLMIVNSRIETLFKDRDKLREQVQELEHAVFGKRS